MAAARTTSPLPASAVLLLLAGAALAGAAAVRWQPCFTGDGAACVLAQDHSRDYDLVSAPFVPIVGAVLLAAAGSVLLAAFWALQARRGASVPARVAAWAASALLAASAVGQVLAAASGGALGVLPADPGAAAIVLLVVQSLLTLVPLVAALLQVPSASGTARLAWVVVGAGALIAAPTVEFMLLIPYSGSHDTPTGFGWVRAGTLVIAGAAFLATGAQRGASAARRTVVATGR